MKTDTTNLVNTTINILITKKNIISLFLFLLITSCNKKENYNSLIYNVISEKSNKVKIEYDSINKTIDFEFNKIKISGKIENDKINFDNKKIISKKISFNNNELSFDIKINNIRYYIVGHKEKSNKIDNKLSIPIIINLLKERTIEEREKLNRKDVKRFLVKFSSENFAFTTKIFNEGDIVILFDVYSEMDKLKDDWHIFNIRKAISQKKPFLIVLHKTEGVVTGNRFEDGGLNENQVGYTYSYGNYQKEVKFLKIRFVSFDYINIGLTAEDVGYFYYYDKNNSGWIKTYEGLYDFNHETDYTDNADNNYFKNNIISKIYNKNYKLMNGIIRNDKVIWNNNNNINILFDDIEH